MPKHPIKRVRGLYFVAFEANAWRLEVTDAYPFGLVKVKKWVRPIDGRDNCVCSFRLADSDAHALTRSLVEGWCPPSVFADWLQERQGEWKSRNRVGCPDPDQLLARLRLCDGAAA
ncbi:hypothetical protein [Frigoriglobus tundricola]|uniref:Uncharacterized protein n=1 Tax=Frigoriglobus tundricola TaxID=2774151 RepID=A0A6M5YJE3_9BACT|nr:hypothetical protein [Frigoriglobus tundricola]QJW94199.1 hypothetical protein FTUN_1719 [Frigoriglobus tundricola]